MSPARSAGLELNVRTLFLYCACYPALVAPRSGGSVVAGSGCRVLETPQGLPCDLVSLTLDALHCVEKNNSAKASRLVETAEQARSRT